MQVGAKIDEVGTLVRAGDSVVLRRDRGGRYRLDLRRTPMDDLPNRVRVIGTYVGDEVVDVEGARRA